MAHHQSITDDRIHDAAEEAICGLGNPGFCKACGADYDGIEPDGGPVECPECGEFQVYGTMEFLY